MARNKSEWPAKVLALVRGGNLTAAIAQIKVAPTVGDVTRLQALLAQLEEPPVHQPGVANPVLVDVQPA